ncbi:WRKY domain containing protein [Parasponia andersonii]|uniref:WRKY domain containing protein n=1 Tax=Parasponia andersonii TaxID=3476 RepID=A0A2P5DCX3_PARAD|nr:WRKY domain containing protein [Parasponia andersonii]
MGTCIWPENLSKRLMKELVQGRDMATQLQILLHKPFGEHGSVSAEELTRKILNSFTETLSVVMRYNNSTVNSTSNTNTINGNISDQFSGGGGGDQVSQVNPCEEASHCDDRNSEDSGESKRRSLFKDRRGCYKRRKNSQSRTTVSPTTEDGQAWRKYGQKEILNAQYPRAYFRCTRKYDQGCRATRQVQQIQDNPKLYQTTYIGEHTCNIMVKAPQMIKDSETWNCISNFKVITSDSSRIIPNTSSSKAPTILMEQGEVVKEETPISDSLSDSLSLGNTEDLWPPELKDLELSEPSMGLLMSQKIMGSNHNGHDQDVVSIMFSFDHQDRTCTSASTTSHGLDMEVFVDKSMDFGNCDFEFDETEFTL